MKKVSILALLVMLAIVSASPAFSDYFSKSYLANDLILSDNLNKGEIDLSAKAEYLTIAEIYIDNSDIMLEPLTKTGISSFTFLVVPLRFSVGLTDNLTARLTAPFVKIEESIRDDGAFTGYGLGDSKLEFLYMFTKESADLPGIALNIGATMPKGTNINSLGMNEFPYGTGATDVYVSGILAKKIGEIDSKFLVGYASRGKIKWGTTNIDPGDAIMLSAAGSGMMNKDLEVGAEISGFFTGEDNVDSAGLDTTTQDKSPVTEIRVSPYITQKVGEGMHVKYLVEVPVTTRASLSPSDLILHEMRGVNVSIGFSWLI